MNFLAAAGILCIGLCNYFHEDFSFDKDLKNFLDFLWNDAKKNPLNLVSYTSEMDARISALTEGVEVD